MTEYSGLDLEPQHATMLRASAISPEVALARGYRTVRTKAEAERLGFSPAQRLVRALAVPVWQLGREVAFHQIRPDRPRMVDGKWVKYETPRGARMVLDVSPAVRHLLGDPRVPLWITEGIRKGDALASLGLCVIALLGVWNWRGTNAARGPVALGDWEAVALKDADGTPRRVYLSFDSDVVQKPEVRRALARLKEFLESRGAEVFVVLLPSGEGGAKVGVDDYLAGGHTVEDLYRLAVAAIPPGPESGETGHSPYVETEDGIVWNKHTKDGPVPTLLANFRARIVSNLIRDDGVEQQRVLEIEAGVRGRTTRVSLPSAEFVGMNWPVRYLGSDAILSPGMGLRDHARAAIQHLSGSAPCRVVYTHLGWRLIDGERCFLTTTGALGTSGLRTDIHVELPAELSRYALPAPPEAERRRTAILASLALLDVGANDLLAVPLAAAYRAVLGDADFAVHHHGKTNTFKTECAVLVLMHFGPAWTRKGLLSWLGTGNSIEYFAFVAKDVPLIVDDFVPTGTVHDIARKQQEAERVFRGQGNLSGRSRLRADGSARATRWARGIVISTGEEIPRGQSLGTRYVGVAFEEGAVSQAALRAAQRKGRENLYAAAMSAYLAWLAPRLDDIRAGLDERVAAIRDRIGDSSYRRMATNSAELFVGIDLFLEFAQGAGAISGDEAVSYRERFWNAFLAADAEHRAIVGAGDPAPRFVELVRSALTSGLGHLASMAGAAPDQPDLYGWRETDDGPRRTVRPQGDRIGWVDADDIFLDREASLRVAQKAAATAGDVLPVSGITLMRRLKETGLLASTDEGRGRLTVRRTVGAARREVIHLKRGALYPGDGADEPPPGQSGGGTGTVCPTDRPAEITPAERDPGRLGRLGRSQGGGGKRYADGAGSGTPRAPAQEMLFPAVARPNRPAGAAIRDPAMACDRDSPAGEPSREPSQPPEVPASEVCDRACPDCRAPISERIERQFNGLCWNCRRNRDFGAQGRGR